MILPHLLLLLGGLSGVLQAEAAKSQEQIVNDYEARNLELQAQVDVVRADLNTTALARDGIQRREAALRERAEQLEERLASVGRTRATGIVMRRAFDALPSSGELRAAARVRQERISALDLRLVSNQAQLEHLGNPQQLISRILGEAPDPDQAERLRRLIANRQVLLNEDLLPSEQLLRDRLLEEDQISRAHAELAERLRKALRAQLVWVRSPAEELTEHEERSLLLSTEAWSTLGQELSFGNAPTSAYVLLLLGIGLFLARPTLRARVQRSAQRINRYRTDTAWESLAIAGICLLRALPLPLMMHAGADLLDETAMGGIADALESGLEAAARLLLGLAFLHHVCAVDGLASKHFGWNTDGVAALRRALRWATPVLVIAYGTQIAFAATGAGIHENGIARFAFLLTQFTVATVLARTLSPTGPLMQQILEAAPHGWLHKTRLLWIPLRFGLPIGAALLAAFGWTFAAEVLASGVARTLILAATIALITGLLYRWRDVQRRRIAVEETLRRREANAEGSASEFSVDEDKVDLPSIDAQTRQLFRTSTVLAGFIGLYSIWAMALPVLGFLDRVEVWPTPRIVDERVELLAGGPAAELAVPDSLVPEESTEPAADVSLPASPPSSPSSLLQVDSAPSGEVSVVTLQHLFVGILFLLGTFVVTRNVTGLVEILLVRSTSMAADSRLATSSLVRYTLTLIGLILAFRAVGIAWSQVQWLAAALTFGLAFGLQEIFANFVSGLIILFERPVRIGDTVTVGTVTGTVSRIRTRATTITDWDRKELLVPNKSFITDHVVNWSLSDPILRITVDVGVAYGSDPKLVEKLLLKAAASTEHVLEDPIPRALFSEFGDSALLFKLRTFIPNIDHLFDVRSNLHKAIVREFASAGIEIAFPQRDLHIRGWNPNAAVPTVDSKELPEQP